MRSMRFDYHEEEQALYLVYSPDAFLGSFDSLVKGMKSENGILLKKTFLISRDSVDLQDDDIDDEIEEIHIKIGELVDNYIRFSPLIMMTEHNFYFSKDMKLTVDLFVAYRNISILRKIDRMIDRDLYIGNGGKEYEGISEEDYRQLVKATPHI